MKNNNSSKARRPKPSRSQRHSEREKYSAAPPEKTEGKAGPGSFSKFKKDSPGFRSGGPGRSSSDFKPRGRSGSRSADSNQSDESVFEEIIYRRLKPDAIAKIVRESQFKIAQMLNSASANSDGQNTSNRTEIHSGTAPQNGLPEKNIFSAASKVDLPFAPSKSYLKKTPQQNAVSTHKSSTTIENISVVADKKENSIPTDKVTAAPERGFAKARARLLAALSGEIAPIQAEIKAHSVEKKIVVPIQNALSANQIQKNPPEKIKISKIEKPGEKSLDKDTTPGGLQLDPWQREALDHLLADRNVVVDAPTSAGKTRVIEALLEHQMKLGVKMIYTSPVKSLSNDKYREFVEKYGKDKVGINTGDFKENLSAPIVLATLETYRNSLLGVEPNMSRRTVVYDEYHYLQDESRGSAWEESLILTPKESQVVLLSASVPNAEDFASWIQSLNGKECRVVRVTKRPVPLVDLVFLKGHGWVFPELLNITQAESAEIKKINRAMANDRSRRFRKGNRFSVFVPPINKALEAELGPVVVYAGRRADVEAVAVALSKEITSPFKAADAERLSNRLEHLSGWDHVPADLQRLIRRYGIAFHHSGMIPPGRVAIESLLKEGLLRVCTGTMGISLGVNFAVRSALVSDESRPSENGETRYSNSEVLQMLGRAGRRGHDKQGFSLWLNLGRYFEQKPREREACRSSLKFDPTTVLGILGQTEDFSYLSEFYRKSFFMRGRDPREVLVEDHTLIHSYLYKTNGIETLPCADVPTTYTKFLEGKQRSNIECYKCDSRKVCHDLMATARGSVLQRIVKHLQLVKALEGPKPTKFGNLARHFPQAGGLIIARWIADGQMNAGNFKKYIPAMAMFSSAHFKEIPETFVDVKFLKSLEVPKLIEKFYPEEMFPELYDERDNRFARDGQEKEKAKVFREFNIGAASIVSGWLDKKLSWDTLVEEHSSKYFSAGDCMMVLFRVSTFLQSCARLRNIDPQLADLARESMNLLLREPLDARHRMLQEEEEKKQAEELEAETQPNQ